MNSRVVLALLVLLVSAGPAVGQDGGPARPSGVLRPADRGSQETEVKLTVARQLLRAKNYAGASAILEGLYESDPADEMVQNLLLNCYLQMQLYTKAETLTRRRVEQRPNSLAHRLTLAEVVARLGRMQEALAAYDTAMTLVQPGDTGRHLLLIRSLISHSFENRALELIDSVRAWALDSMVFALERGSILESQKEYARAAAEYVPLLAADTAAAARAAERRLLALLSFAESSPAVEQVLLVEAGRTDNVRTLRLLSLHYLNGGRFEDAFGTALRLDSMENRDGLALVQYLRQCREHKSWSQVVMMGEYIGQRYPESPFVSEVLFQYADGLTRTGNVRQAIATYRRIIGSYPDTERVTQALYAIGAIYFDYLNECDTALDYFDSIVAGPVRDISFLKALQAMPRCHVRLGRLDRAKEGFEELLRLNVNDDISEEADYHLALIGFYEKQYDSAEVALRRLMVDYPRGFFVNDALHLLLVLDAAEGSEDVLYDYSNALYFEERLMNDSARVRLERLSGMEGGVLADLALFRLAELDLARSDTAVAVQNIDLLAERFPDSYYLPYGMKIKADILALDPETLDEARALYALLLENYPDCPFVSDVRRRLRELDVDRKIG
ncbi:MAG TPA: tetratricopeptide repeat protein [Acidobacteriota bacterium]|nr:tetratricopeptide repeat protein [Acidobacteriota bacterium]